MQTSHRQEELEYQEAGLETTDEAIRRLWKEGQAFLVPVLYENCENLKVPRDELIKFAKNLKQAPRFLFGDTRDELFRLRDEVDKLSAENEQLKSTSSCYMNQDHPQYAPKLHAAVLFWEKHFSGSGYGPSNVKNAFQVWYQDTWVKPLSGDKFTSTSQDNIAKVATPRNRKGGREKNSD